MWKCFDQIQWGFLYDLLEKGGLPLEVLTAYRNFHSQVEYLNTIGNGLGGPHYEPCGIPQGCPMSMTFIAFIFHAWARIIRRWELSPGALLTTSLCMLSGIIMK